MLIFFLFCLYLFICFFVYFQEFMVCGQQRVKKQPLLGRAHDLWENILTFM